MKRIGLLLLATLRAACAANVTREWDFNDPAEEVSHYHIYEMLGTNYVWKAVVPGTTNRVTISGVSAARRAYVATASNYWGESVFSNPAWTPKPGNQPTNVNVVK